MGQVAVSDAPAEAFVIEGGRALSGHVKAAGNKNGALPILAACLLTREPVTLENVPRIRDVETMVELIGTLGVEIEWTGPNSVRVQAAEIETVELDDTLAKRIRTSLLLAGPLLARERRAVVPPPGGDVIGRRRIDTHIHALAELGAEIGSGGGTRWRRRARGRSILLDEASVTATENAVMAAVPRQGETVLYNAACEPHVQDLCRFLGRLGARIEGIGSNRLHIEGVERLPAALADRAGSHRGGELHRAGRGDRRRPHDRRPVPEDLVRSCPRSGSSGIEVETSGTSVHVPDGAASCVVAGRPRRPDPEDRGRAVAAVPGRPDLDRADRGDSGRGTVLIFEKMFESRLFFVDKLVDMGARIILCDPHRAIVSGPARLYGQRMDSPDIRAGWAMLIASLCAEGASTIGNIGQIVRGYERIEERLRALGAQMERVEG